MTINPILHPIIMFALCFLLLLLVLKSKNSTNQSKIIRIFIILLLFIMNLRIMIISSQAEMISNNLDVLLVMDTTISMNAEDFNGEHPRIKQAKKDAFTIIDKFYGAKFSLITFNNDARIQLPYTKDSKIVQNSIDILDVMNELYAKGTSLNVVKSTMKQALQASKKEKDRFSIVFFMSDGEMTNNEELNSFEELKPFIDYGIVLGYGTTNGGYMKIKNKYTGKEEYVKDRTSSDFSQAISKINEKNLQQIAKDLDIDYLHVEMENTIDKKLDSMLASTNKKINKDNIDNIDNYMDTYYVFAFIIFCLLLYDFVIIKRRT